MRYFLRRVFKALAIIATFSLVGFVVVRVIFELICWTAGHGTLENMIGLVASIGFGGWIGVEAYLWFLDWRWRKRASDFDASH
ncbi:hypothetical protein ASD54_23595 [Rhizobium sp. Root149]|uniref:hypothetical protein n=1 Tax=Rhizobium sp. Root149 TaxID=1736473 RepID=UPI000712EA77|nr:hypothetical protein [Rhizobium sp. Root149]KQZ59768.1 hypothetical protein ASD54_23595 [Rhizobium sp. Root149]